MTVFQKMVVESILPEPNQMILVSFFSEDNGLSLMISQYAIFSNIRVTKIERSAFWGTPGIVFSSKQF